MPTFYREVEIDFDISDLMYDLSKSDIEDVIEYLIDNDYISENQSKTNGESSLAEREFNEMIDKIADNRLRLTAEEDALLRKIADRF
jgi:hypothetical protein